MKIKTSELSGIALDWAVAKAEVIPSIDCEVIDGSLWYGRFTSGLKMYCPSIDWAQGGAIIERENIGFKFVGDFNFVAWKSHGIGAHQDEHSQYGETPLIAAMRCYVASKLGDEVEIHYGMRF